MYPLLTESKAVTNRRSTPSDSSCLGTTMCSAKAGDLEGRGFDPREGLYLGFDAFFDLNMEVNFCLKEVLELVEKMEDLELEDIVKGLKCGGGGGGGW